jgi:hypothetical protein
VPYQEPISSHSSRTLNLLKSDRAAQCQRHYSGYSGKKFSVLSLTPKTPEKCMIFTDSMSSFKALLSRKISHRTHPLVYECKKMCSDLLWSGVEVEIMWIPSHVGFEGNLRRQVKMVLFLINHFCRSIFRFGQDPF